MAADSQFRIPASKPLFIVVSGISGAGKDAVVRGLQSRGLPLHFVVTATDRPPRRSETDGVDYFFLSKERFSEMITADEFLEHADVYTARKGIPRQQVRDAIASGLDMILRVDVQGAQTLRSMFGDDIVLIFITPDDEQNWKRQLIERRTDSDDELKARLEKARLELGYLPLFDYCVINRYGQLEQAVDQLETIILAEHRRVHHRNFMA